MKNQLCTLFFFFFMDFLMLHSWYLSPAILSILLSKYFVQLYQLHSWFFTSVKFFKFQYHFRLKSLTIYLSLSVSRTHSHTHTQKSILFSKLSSLFSFNTNPSPIPLLLTLFLYPMRIAIKSMVFCFNKIGFKYPFHKVWAMWSGPCHNYFSFLFGKQKVLITLLEED